MTLPGTGRAERERERDQRATRQRLRREQFEADLRWWMSDPRGRRIAAWFLASNGEDPTRTETSFTGNSKTFLLEGMRQSAKALQAQLISITPEQYLAMLRDCFFTQEFLTNERRDDPYRPE